MIELKFELLTAERLNVKEMADMYITDYVTTKSSQTGAYEKHSNTFVEPTYTFSSSSALHSEGKYSGATGSSFKALCGRDEREDAAAAADIHRESQPAVQGQQARHANNRWRMVLLNCFVCLHVPTCDARISVCVCLGAACCTQSQLRTDAYALIYTHTRVHIHTCRCTRSGASILTRMPLSLGFPRS